MAPWRGEMDNELRDLFLAASRITGRNGDPLHLVLLRISRRRPEDDRVRAILDELFHHPLAHGSAAVEGG
jgi:hypothetical protein